MAAPSTDESTRLAMMHQAFFWLKDPSDDAARAALIAGLRTLKGIPQVHALRITVPAATEQRDVVDASWSVCETMEFASLEDQAAYQLHPIHKTFIAQCGPLWSRVVVYDGADA
jgi:hypothetical protein